MKIIIAGDGKVGLALTRLLLREEHDLVVVDSNAQVLKTHQEQYDVMTVLGNAATMETLRQAGVETADLLIAATSADELNLLCCLIGKKMNPKLHTIARVRTPEYTEQLFALREEFGLSMTINPELSAAREIFRILQFPSFLRRDTFAKGRVEIVELSVEAGSPLDGIALSALYHIARVKVLVCAVEREGQVTIPGGSYVLRQGDHIYVTAQSVYLAQLIKNLKIGSQKIRQTILVGGGRVSYYLAERLLSAGVGVKIIEKDEARARYLAEHLPQATVICGDGSDNALLESEGIDSADAVATLTGMDEENIVVSMYACSRGVRKVVTEVDRLDYGNMFINMGIGSVISPKELCSTSIAQYVRAMEGKVGNVLTLHRIANGGAEALEFRVDAETPWCGQALKDIPLKKGVLIACITHKGNTIIPDGSSKFEPGDTVVVVTTCENPFHQMSDIFD